MIDKLDYKLIGHLINDAKASYRKLAKATGASASTVLSRIKKLEDAGIIRGYTTDIDYEKLGYDLTAVVDLTISQGKLTEVETRVSKFKNVIAVYDVTGDKDSIVIAKFQNRQELNHFIKTILKIQYVERTNTKVVLNTVKEKFNIF
ncbi:MAG: Lrp/AsnC family transcriptional regulator [Candidatus Altiarchaeota archaeon]|nr:Lrp/AsnC family transcriptional regulator [Candidatus Altiarchaeota archaeon]